MLLPFARHNINLTRIESRPSQQKAWEYVFFIDFLGHVEDAVVQETLEEAGDHARNLKVLGSFPRAELQEYSPLVTEGKPGRQGLRRVYPCLRIRPQLRIGMFRPVMFPRNPENGCVWQRSPYPAHPLYRHSLS